MAHVHARSMEKRPPVLFNDLGQPVGPTMEVVLEFNHLLGTLAKDSTFAPLNFVSWRYMPLKDKIWEYVQVILHIYYIIFHYNMLKSIL